MAKKAKSHEATAQDAIAIGASKLVALDAIDGEAFVAIYNGDLEVVSALMDVPAKPGRPSTRDTKAAAAPPQGRWLQFRGTNRIFILDTPRNRKVLGL